MHRIAPSLRLGRAPLLTVLLWVAAAPSAGAATTTLEQDTPISERLVGQEVAFAHPPLDNPETRSVRNADHMRPDDVVAGLTIGEVSRAYPWWVLKNHHAVNDSLAGEPILIAFCEQCSAATGFRRRVADRVLTMETEGIGNGSIILRDRQTGTLWAPFDGHGLEGELAGRQLERLQVFLTTWEDWQRRHPETDVVYARPALREGHGSREHPGKWGIVGEMGETLRTWDTRLAENELIYGVTEAGQALAYPFRWLEKHGGVVNDQVGQRPIVVVARGAFEMAAYDRRLGGRVLGFESTGAEIDLFRDLETGSLWTIEGIAVSGPHAGARLTPVDGYSVEWHVWSEYHPDSEVFGLQPSTTHPNAPFPFTALPRLVGERVRVAPLDLDRPLNIVVVWARWCPPCRDKMPLLSRLAASTHDRGYRFQSIAVQLPDPIELANLKGFVFEQKIDWPIYLFEDSQYAVLDDFCRQHNGRGLVIPTAFLIDGEGRVQRILEGAELDEIDSVIEQLSGSTLGTRLP